MQLQRKWPDKHWNTRLIFQDGSQMILTLPDHMINTKLSCDWCLLWLVSHSETYQENWRFSPDPRWRRRFSSEAPREAWLRETIAMYGMCWLSLHVFTVALDFYPAVMTTVDIHVLTSLLICCHSLAMSNSFADPIIDRLTNERFRVRNQSDIVIVCIVFYHSVDYIFWSFEINDIILFFRIHCLKIC